MGRCIGELLLRMKENKANELGITYEDNNSIIDSFKNDYFQLPTDILISKWILENIPFIFHGDKQHYLEVKSLLSKQIQIDSCSIVFVGSSSVGFSLSPNKHFKRFDDTSDIDIAVISHYYFDIAWRTIRNIDIHSQPPLVQRFIIEHRNRLIYWGTIATDKILGLLPFGVQWLKAIEALKTDPIFKDRKISFRLYQDYEALRQYHVNNFSRNIQEVIGVIPSVKQL